MDDLMEEANAATVKLLDALEGSGSDMAASLGALHGVRRAHAEKRHSPDEAHSALEDLLNQIIRSTQDVHATVTTSHDDLQLIRSSIT